MKILLFILGVLLCNCVNGQINPAYNKIELTSKGITKKQSELIFEKTKFFPNQTQLSIAIVRNGKVNYIGTKRENDTIQLINNHKNTFEIGSITKVFTATLLSIFVHEQKLQLDDNIQTYLDFIVNSKNPITFKQLANHTSGLPKLPSNLSLLLVDPDNPYKAYNKEKLVQYLQKHIKLKQDAKTEYKYSNLGAGILGFGLASISKKSYESLLQEKIFKKYKMSNSTSKRDKIKSKLVKGLKPTGEIAHNWDFDILAGAGAILSTAEDLSKFALTQFDRKNIELTLTQKPTFHVNEIMDIGLGWHIIKKQNGDQLIWHNGATGGYTSSMALDLKQKNGIIILSNVSAFHPKMINIDQLCFGLIKSLTEKK